MNPDQQSSHPEPRANASPDLHHALWQALVVTAIAIVILKSLTGIIWFGALLVAAIVFALSLGWILRTRRGMRR